MYGLLMILMMAIAFCFAVYFCRKFHLFTLIKTWIKSTTEEKVGLTKLVGHFNANGYLVHSDSDIYIGHSGSFKRFESIDKDIRIATTSFINSEWCSEKEDAHIPPQPLRPAPVPLSSIRDPLKESPLEEKQSPLEMPELTTSPLAGTICDSLPMETSINPLPRPVSSINMSALQQSNSQYIQPPPTPHGHGHGRVSVSGPCTGLNLANEVKWHQQEQQAPQVPQQNDLTISINDRNKGNAAAATATGDYVEVISGVLRRAISCDSVCSDTSVALGDLEDSNITGYLCIGLEYDSENGEMIANVLEAKDLVNPSYAIGGSACNDDPLDTYVKIFLLPDKNVNVQTKIYRNSTSPSYQERVIFTLHPRDQMNTALLFHIYATDMNSHTLLGEGELSLADVSLRQPVTTWVTLTDTSQTGTEFGELMFSLSYLPTAERLTVVVVKGRKLKFQSEKEPGEPFVKAYLLQYGKKIHKKKTSSKKPEKSPIFNESMMFNIPAHMLQTIQIRLTVAEMHSEASRTHSIGHVIIGAQASGRSLAHWNQMLQALRRPVAMWHPLRK